MKKWKDIWQGWKLSSKFTVIIVLFVMLPTLLFSVYVFRSMEKNAVSEKLRGMEYGMENSYGQIRKNVDSINMSTQFFINDQELLDFLADVKNGKPVEREEISRFYHENIASLERLVNNNPYLYQIRVYTENDNVQEMMPILYKHSRMQRMEWAAQEPETGWKFNYTDRLFDSFVMNQNKKIMSLVSEISDYENGKLATLEVGMDMATMFPVLYEQSRQQWSCFVDADGNCYYGIGESSQEKEELVEEILMELDGGQEAFAYSIGKGRGQMAVSVLPVKELSGVLISVQSLEEEIDRIYQMRNQFIGVMAAVTLLLAAFIHELVRGMFRKFYDILGAIRQVQKGNLDVRIEDCGRDEMGELGMQINTMLDHIRKLMEDNLSRELLAKNSEIKALQNQINAHFIYNVLESIKMMAEIEEMYEISDAITSLGKLLRYGMRWVSGNVTVAEEIEYIQNYLLLINLRFDYEIILSLNVPELIRKQEIPKMTLQPIVENAIYHGIEQMAEDTSIYIKGIVDGEDCLIEITDAGKGMSEEEVERLRQKIAGAIETTGGSGNGIGLKNVQDRIKMSFGERYGMEIMSKLGCYTKIIVRIPLKKRGAANEDGIDSRG